MEELIYVDRRNSNCNKYLGDDCKIDIEDHINTELYEEALAEATKSYGDEAPDFYEAQQKFFDENDK